jgi:hypothetical protein
MNAMGLILLTSLVIEPIPSLNNTALKKEQDECWLHLQYDEKKIMNALFRLAARPRETTSYLKSKVKPLKLEKKEAIKLIKDLDSDDEKIWKPAFETLSVFDPRLAMNVKDAFEMATPGSGQTRLVALLCGLQPDVYEGMHFTFSVSDNTAMFNSGRRGFGTSLHVNTIWSCKEWNRLNYAVIVLEHLRTQDAIELLKLMATGHPDAEPTREAKTALKRIAKSKGIGTKEYWADLLNRDRSATRAMLQLSQSPKETVRFLKEQIVPINTEKHVVVKHLKALESEDEKIWKPAYEQFQLFDPRLVMSLKDAFEAVPPGIGQPRIVSILFGSSLEDFEGKAFTLQLSETHASFQCGNHSWGCVLGITDIWKPAWVRYNRSILLLEHIGTLEAIEVLKTIAKSHPDIGPTKAAKAALKRLNAE